MSAPNFAKNNAEDYYCVGMNREDDDFIDWDLIMEDIRQVAYQEHDFYSIDESDRDCDRSLNYVTKKQYEMKYGGETYYADVMLGVRSGYYVGANIDYDIKLYEDVYMGPDFDLHEGDTRQLVEDFVSDKYEYEHFTVNKGLAIMNRKGLEKRLTQWLDSIVADCEKIAKTCAEEELVKVAQFYNGEAIYERKTPRNEMKAALLEVV